MVSLSAILPASALVLAALATTQVDAHGYMYLPLAEFDGSANSAWIVQIDPTWSSDDWDGNTEQSVTTYETLAAENSVTDLRTLLDDTSLYGADCGYTLSDADAKDPPTDGTATFSRGMVHVGPCEIWLDDTKVMTDSNCYATYGGDDQDVKSVFPVDYSSCSTSGCMLRFYWLAFQGVDSETKWQVYKDCVPLTGPASSTSSTTSTTTTSASTANEADSTTTTSSATTSSTSSASSTPTSTTTAPSTSTSSASTASTTSTSTSTNSTSSAFGGSAQGGSTKGSSTQGGMGANGQSFGFGGH